jgi:hypothetical protein
MALTFQGMSKADIEWSLATKLEARQAGTGSFVDVGVFGDFSMTIDPLSKPGDPANTEYVYAVRYAGSFNLWQTDKTKEIAMLAGVAGTGLYDTDMELKVTFIGGRVITLGAASGYPLRLVAGYVTGRGDGPTLIPVKFANTEPVTSVAAKIA